ncbi:hypothetical protein [Pantoea sp. BAV 3049]|uniref:hypothetical protein n=1 Tax=Pantoea sp. BAV 3049 TaxID=2654188 RepID=UPI00131AD006|nr:hypothetical protein [Pantoea sp. BAV 3049]
MNFSKKKDNKIRDLNIALAILFNECYFPARIKNKKAKRITALTATSLKALGDYPADKGQKVGG